MNVILVVGVTLLAGVSGNPILDDGQSFVFRVMENDDVWKQHLRTGVKVNTNLVSKTARRVLRGANIIAHEPPAEGGRATVTANALVVIANVATRHYAESEALEFAFSVIASAIKCHVLPYVSIQLHAIAATDEADRGPLLIAVRKTLATYVDKLARLKEPLDAESEMFRDWEEILKHVVNDLTRVRALVNNDLLSTCEVGTHEHVLKTMNLDSTTENFDSPSGTKAIFDKCQREVTDILDDIPIYAMDSNIRDEYIVPKVDVIFT